MGKNKKNKEQREQTKGNKGTENIFQSKKWNMDIPIQIHCNFPTNGSILMLMGGNERYLSVLFI